MAFRFDKLTTKAQGLVAEAQSQATSAGNPEIDPLHLLAAMLSETDGITRPLLQKINVDAEQLGKLVTSELIPPAGDLRRPPTERLAGAAEGFRVRCGIRQTTQGRVRQHRTPVGRADP
jgi:hypothetical protein